MNTELVIQIVGVLLVLFFCFATFMCSKTWRIWHVIFSFFCFAGTITFLIFVAMVMKTHSSWRIVAADLEKKIEAEHARSDQLIKGDPDANPGELTALQELRDAYNELMLDRGRVWRGCTVTGGNVSGQGGSLTFNLPAPAQPNPDPAPADPAADPDAADPDAADGADPPAEVPTVAPVGLEANSLVYIFQEEEQNFAGGSRVGIPKTYLGEFRVSGVNGTQVQLVPTIPVFPTNGFVGTWTLYETMPLDTHDLFVNMADDEVRRIMAAAGVPAETANDYARDFDQAQPNDEPENVWHRIEFIRSYEDYAVDSDSVYTQLAGDYFDATGRAIEERLRRGDLASFEAGTKGMFPQDAAKQLVDNQFCDETTVQHVYVRPLRDYVHYFRDLYLRGVTLTKQNVELKEDILVIAADNTTSLEFQNLKTAEKESLENDLMGFQNELDEVTTFHAALVGKINTLKKRLSSLYAETHYVERRLDEIDEQLKQQPAAPPTTTASWTTGD